MRSGSVLTPCSVSQAFHGDWMVPVALLMPAELLVQRRVVGEQRAADGGVVAVDELGRRLQHHVGTEQQRLLERRREQGVVDDDDRACRVAEARGGGDVGELQGRVGGGLEEEQLGRPRECGLERREIGSVDELRLDAEARQHLLEEPHGAAVGDVGEHRAVAGGEERQRQHGGGGKAGRVAGAVRRPLERREPQLQRGHRRVARAAVGVPLVLAHRLADVGGGLVDRDQDGAGRGVGDGAGVEGLGLERRRGRLDVLQRGEGGCHGEVSCRSVDVTESEGGLETKSPATSERCGAGSIRWTTLT